MPTRQQIVDICTRHGLLTDPNPIHRLTNSGDRYAAVTELSKLYAETKDPMQSARTAIWNTLNRVHLGLDPLKENRGGARAGSGRKFTKKQTNVT